MKTVWVVKIRSYWGLNEPICSIHIFSSKEKARAWRKDFFSKDDNGTYYRSSTEEIEVL